MARGFCDGTHVTAHFLAAKQPSEESDDDEDRCRISAPNDRRSTTRWKWSSSGTCGIRSRRKKAVPFNGCYRLDDQQLVERSIVLSNSTTSKFLPCTQGQGRIFGGVTEFSEDGSNDFPIFGPDPGVPVCPRLLGCCLLYTSSEPTRPY